MPPTHGMSSAMPHNSPDPTDANLEHTDTSPGTPGRFFLRPPSFLNRMSKTGSNATNTTEGDQEQQLTPLTTLNPSYLENNRWDEIPDDSSSSAPWYKRTRTRRRLCVGIPLLTMVFGIFFAVRISQALPMLQSSPAITSFQLGEMCDKVINFNVSGTINNPGQIGAMLVPSDNSKLSTEDGLLGTAQAEAFELLPGNQTFRMTGTFTVCDECIETWQQVLQRWFDGEAIAWNLALEMNAQFGPSAFIIPISFGTTLNIARQINSYVNDDPNPTVPRDIDGNEIKRFAMLDVPAVSNPQNEIALRMGFDLRPSYTPGGYQISMPLPPLKFAAFINDAEAGTGVTEEWRFGGPYMENLVAFAEAGPNTVPALQDAIFSFSRQIDFTYAVTGRASAAEQEACFAQAVVEGVRFSNKFQFVEASNTGENPSIGLSSTSLMNVKSSPVGTQTSLAIDFDVSALTSWNNLRGSLPALGLSVSVNSTEQASRDQLGEIIASGFDLQQGADILSDVNIDVYLTNATLFVRTLEQVVNSRVETPLVYVRTIPDDVRFGLISRVLSSWEFAIDPSAFFSSSSDEQNNNDDSQIPFDSIGTLAIVASQDDLVVSSSIDFAGIVGDQVHAAWQQLSVDLSVTKDNGLGETQNESTEQIFQLRLPQFDSNDNNTVEFMLRVLDDEAQGESLFSYLEHFFVDYKPVWAVAKIVYGASLDETFNFPVARSYLEATVDRDGNSDKDDGQSFFKPKLVELDGLVNNAFEFNTESIINLPVDLTLSLDSPIIAVGIARCSDPQLKHIVGIQTRSPIDFTYDEADEQLDVPLSLDLLEAEGIFDTLSDFQNGREQNLCIVPHPTVSNFISQLITSVNLQLVVDPSSDSESAFAAAESVLDIAITGETNQACLNVDLDVGNLESDDTETLALRWGDVNLVFAKQTPNTDFFSLLLPGGAIGGGLGGENTEPLEIKLCLISDDALSLDQGATNAGMAVTSIVERETLAIAVSGSVKSPDGSSSNQVNAQFTIPPSAYDAVFGEEGGASSSDEPVVQLNALQLLGMKDNTDVEVGITAALRAGILKDTAIKLSVPELGIALKRCLASEPVLSVYSNAAALEASSTTSTPLELDVVLQLGVANEVGEVLKQFRDSNNEFSVCLGRPTNIPNFLSRVLGSSGIEFDLSSDDESTNTEGLINSVDIALESLDDKICLQAGIDFQPMSETRLQWDDVKLAIQLSSISVFEVEVTGANLVAGGTSTPSDISLCLVAGNADLNAGSTRVKQLVESFLDKTPIAVQLAGSVESQSGPTLVQNSLTISSSLWEGIAGSGNGNSSLSIDSVVIEGLVSNQIQLSAVSNLDLELGFDVTFTYPDLGVSAGVCGAPSIVSVSVPKSTVPILISGSAPSVLELGIAIDVSDGDELLNAYDTYSDGVDQTLCIGAHPGSEYQQFIGSVLSKVDLNTVITGSSGATGSSTLDLVVSSDSRNVCASIDVEIEASGEDQVTVSWPQIDLEVTRKGDSDHIVELSFPKGSLLGTAQTPTLQVCAVAPAPGTISDAADRIQNLLTAIDDRTQLGFQVSGSIGAKVASADFDVPLAAYDSFLGVEDPNAPDFLKVKSIQPSKLIGTTLGVSIAADLNLEQKVSLTLPPVMLRLDALGEDGEMDVALGGVVAKLPVIVGGSSSPTSLSSDIDLTLLSWENTFAELERLIDQENYKIVGGGPKGDTLLGQPVNFLSRVIPDFEFKVKGTDEGETAPPTNPSIDLAIRIDSDDVAATIGFDAKLLEAIDIGFTWDPIVATLGDGANDVAILTIPAPTGGVLQSANSQVSDVSLVFSGDAAVAVGSNILRGVDDMLLELSGAFSGSPSSIDIAVTIPKRFLGLLRRSSTEEVTEAPTNQAITFGRVAILGGDEVGTDVMFPCVLDSICEDTVKSDQDLSYTGLTLGLGVQLDLGSFGRVQLQADLLSDLWLSLRVNGLDQGRVRVKQGISLASSSINTDPVPLVLTLFFKEGSVDNVRAAVNLFAEGLDAVISVTGSTDDNYVSKLISVMNQDFDLLADSESGVDEGGALSGLDISLERTVKDGLTLGAKTSVEFTEEFFEGFVDLGTVGVNVWYGHDSNGDNGKNVLWGNTKNNDKDSSGNDILTIRPNPVAQELGASVTVGYKDIANRDLMDEFISNFIWNYKYPLEVELDMLPSVDIAMFDPKCSDRAQCAFKFRTYLTVPQRFEDSGFIEKFSVDLLGSLSSVLSGDLKLSATKTLKNTFGWDVIISFFEYKIEMADTDGLRQGDCRVNAGGLFGGGIGHPCGLTVCGDPYTSPTNVIQDDKTASLGFQDRPLVPVTGDWLRVGETGDVNLVLDLTTNTAGRMYDEFYVSGEMCADITEGAMIVAMQADQNCVDNNDNTLGRNDMQCTFVTRVPINLFNFRLAGVGTCTKGFDIRSSDGFKGLRSDNRNYGFNGRQLSTYRETFAKWYLGEPLKVKDTFQFEFDLKIEKECTFGTGRSLTLVFRRDKPASVTSPAPNDWDSWGYTSNIGNSIGLHFAWDRCNSLALFKDGNISEDEDRSLFRSLSIVGEELDSGDTTKWKIIYDGFTKRLRVEHLASPVRSVEWDVDLAAELGSDTAWIGWVGNTMSRSCAKVDISNFRGSVDSTDSTKFVRDPDSEFSLPRKGEIGEVVVRARDPERRHRGDGGDTIVAEIIPQAVVTSSDDPENVPLVVPGCNCSGTVCVCDNDDGSYTVRYRLTQQGRYKLQVWCSSSNCLNVNAKSIITDRLYVRKLAGAADELDPTTPTSEPDVPQETAQKQGDPIPGIVGGTVSAAIVVALAALVATRQRRSIRRRAVEAVENRNSVDEIKSSQLTSSV